MLCLVIELVLEVVEVICDEIFCGVEVELRVDWKGVSIF